MIEITYQHHGTRPSRTEIIRKDVNSASTPPSFAVKGVRYNDPEFTLLVDPPSENISKDAVESIAAAFEDNWGGTIEHINTTQR